MRWTSAKSEESETILDSFSELIRDPDFAAGAIHTGFIQEFLARREPSRERPDAELAQVLAAIAEAQKTKTAATSVAAASSNWLREGRSRLLR